MFVYARAATSSEFCLLMCSPSTNKTCPSDHGARVQVDMVPPELHTLLQALQDTVGQDSTALKDICTNNQQVRARSLSARESAVICALVDVAPHRCCCARQPQPAATACSTLARLHQHVHCRRSSRTLPHVIKGVTGPVRAPGRGVSRQTCHQSPHRAYRPAPCAWRPRTRAPSSRSS